MSGCISRLCGARQLVGGALQGEVCTGTHDSDHDMLALQAARKRSAHACGPEDEHVRLVQLHILVRCCRQLRVCLVICWPLGGPRLVACTAAVAAAAALGPAHMSGLGSLDPSQTSQQVTVA